MYVCVCINIYIWTYTCVHICYGRDGDVHMLVPPPSAEEVTDIVVYYINVCVNTSG